MKNGFTDRHKKIVSIISIIVFIVFSALVAWFVGRPLVKLAGDAYAFRDWINSFGFAGKLIFIGMVILQIIVAVIPGEPLELGAGYAFGAVSGTVLTMIGIVLGSLLVFLLVRFFGVKLLEAFFSVEKINSMKFLHDGKRRDKLFFILMIIPGTPKDLLTYFAGLTDMKMTSWIMISALGRIPSVVTSTFGGAAIAEKHYVTAIIIFAVTLIISGVGFIVYSKINDKKADKS